MEPSYYRCLKQETRNDRFEEIASLNIGGTCSAYCEKCEGKSKDKSSMMPVFGLGDIFII